MENDLLGRVTEVLNDPQQLSQVFALARNLGLPVDAPPSPPPSLSPQPCPPPSPLPCGDQPGLSSLLPLLGGSCSPEALLGAVREDPREEALLSAVRAYCTEPRCRRLERALRIARLSRVAGVLLQSFRERSADV